MSHTISGIVTSFEYQGKFPHRHLNGPFTFIPLSKSSKGVKGYPIWPFEEMTLLIQRQIKDLSTQGLCAYIESDYFGGAGAQSAAVWTRGEIVLGPLLSSQSIAEMSDHKAVVVVAEPINDALKFIGVERDEDHDEFSTVDLDVFRSNEDALK